MDGDKNTLRQRLLAERRHLDPADALGRSTRIRDRLWLVPEFLAATCVFTYVSAKDNEVDTRMVIDRLLAEGREVACPAVVPGGQMVWRKIASLDDLAPGRYGIPEPGVSCPIVTPDRATVVLVPGIVFSRNGHRIGYGGGYFDRFLAAFAGTSIGLAYDFQLVDAVPATAHDVPMNMVITERDTIVPSAE